MIPKSKAISLSAFYWKGHHSSGKMVSGKTLALYDWEVITQLERDNITINKLKKKRISLYSHYRHSLKRGDITLLTRQIATMLQSGIPIIQTLQLIQNNHHKAELKSILLQLCLNLNSGLSLSKSLQVSSDYFDRFYINMIQVGEETGKLSEAFERVANYQQKSEKLRSKTVKAMIYPVTVIASAITVTTLMLIYVIPEFESIFNSFGAQLPWLTQQIVLSSQWLTRNGLTLLIIVLTIMFIFHRLIKRSTKFHLLTSRLYLQIPILGTVISKTTIAAFSSTLATCYSAGVPILSGILTASQSCQNLYYQQQIRTIQDSAASGMPIYLAMRQTDIFPEFVIQMVMIGEESGSLEVMLTRVSNIYEDEVSNTIDNLAEILEPLIIITLGTIIGGIVIAMYLPIFDLMNIIN